MGAGACGGFYLPVRLPHEVAPLFRAWLDEHFPDRAAKVMATIKLAPRRPRQRSEFLQPDARPGALGGPDQDAIREGVRPLRAPAIEVRPPP